MFLKLLNKMKKLKFLFFSTILISVGLSAQVTEIITMRDGNRYSGSILQQNSNGEITFMADTSEVYLPMSDVERIQRYTSAKRGSGEFADIYLSCSVEADTAMDVEENLSIYPVAVDNSLIALADSISQDLPSASVEVVDLSAPVVVEYAVEQDDVIRGVELLEEGSIIKYRSTEPVVKTFKMKDVSSIARPARDKHLQNGLLDEITTKNGRIFKGTIVNTEPGKSVRIESDGRIYTLLISDIVVQRRIPVDPEETIFVQSPLIENIYLTGDKGTIYDVVLIEQNFGKGTFDVIDRKNVINRGRLTDISSIRKEVNRDYKPRKEIYLNPDSLYVNYQNVVSARFDGSKKEIELKNLDGSNLKGFPRVNGAISVISPDSNSFRRMYLMSLGSKLQGTQKIKKSDLLTKSIPVLSQTVNAKTKMLVREFPVNPGYYGLIDTDNSRIYIFRIFDVK